MNNKLLKVYVTDSTLSTLKKRVAESGKSASETARELIEFAFSARAVKESASVSGIAPEAVMEVQERGGSGVSPEALRFLVADVAKAENLLRQISRLLAAENFKEHEERVRIAEHKSERILKNLNLEEVEDVDRLEIKVSTKEETAQILKEMGIGQGGEK